MSVFDWNPRTLRVESGAILPAAHSPGSPSGARRIYLLVHGFNNTPDKAGESYAVFRQRLESAIGKEPAKNVWEFYWPGYEEDYSQVLTVRTGREPSSPLVTGYFYFRQVPKAKTYGEMLGRYVLALQGKTQETEVILIGHSLGCRLILEALSYIARQGAPRGKVPAVLLMAAAVPVSLVELGGDLRAGLEFCPMRFILFSHRDWVLWGCFPLGQELANDGGIAPRAVGWRGGPEGCWTGRQRTHLFHGQYWADEGTTPNVVRLFGKRPAHELPYNSVVPWELAQPPALPAWKLPSRSR